MGEETEGLRDRLARQGEDALGKLAQELLENPLVSGAITRAFDARERAVQAQEAAMGALNIPSAADVERLTRRLRSVSQRLEGIEDGVDRLDSRLERLTEAVPSSAPAEQLAAIEAALARLAGEQTAAIETQLALLTAEVARLAGALGEAPDQVPREQERLEVEGAAAPEPKPATRR